MTIACRPFRAGEVAEAARIHRAAAMTGDWFDPALHTPAEECTFYREQVFPKATLLGAFADDNLLGHCAVRPGWIDQLYVDPPHQSRGIGSALIGQAKAMEDDLQLWAFQSNMGARRFYERHGFAAQEFTDGAGNEEKLPDVRYRWKKELIE